MPDPIIIIAIIIVTFRIFPITFHKELCQLFISRIFRNAIQFKSGIFHRFDTAIKFIVRIINSIRLCASCFFTLSPKRTGNKTCLKPYSGRISIQLCRFKHAILQTIKTVERINRNRLPAFSHRGQWISIITIRIIKPFRPVYRFRKEIRVDHITVIRIYLSEISISNSIRRRSIICCQHRRMTKRIEPPAQIDILESGQTDRNILFSISINQAVILFRLPDQNFSHHTFQIDSHDVRFLRR